jgi:hypothetical protein
MNPEDIDDTIDNPPMDDPLDRAPEPMTDDYDIFQGHIM